LGFFNNIKSIVWRPNRKKTSTGISVQPTHLLHTKVGFLSQQGHPNLTNKSSCTDPCMHNYGSRSPWNKRKAKYYFNHCTTENKQKVKHYFNHCTTEKQQI